MSSIRLIFGFHAVISRLRQNPDSVKEVFLDSARRDQRARDLTKMAESQGLRLIMCDSTRLSRKFPLPFSFCNVHLHARARANTHTYTS